jgi:hypothetical protein
MFQLDIRYEKIMEACGGHSEFVEDQKELGVALKKRYDFLDDNRPVTWPTLRADEAARGRVRNMLSDGRFLSLWLDYPMFWS